MLGGWGIQSQRVKGIGEQENRKVGSKAVREVGNGRKSRSQRAGQLGSQGFSKVGVLGAEGVRESASWRFRKLELRYWGIWIFDRN